MTVKKKKYSITLVFNFVGTRKTLKIWSYLHNSIINSTATQNITYYFMYRL